jgi:hypothetical protein
MSVLKTFDMFVLLCFLQAALRDPQVQALLWMALRDDLSAHFKERHDRKMAQDLTDRLFDALDTTYLQVGWTCWFVMVLLQYDEFGNHMLANLL